ncbi:MAG: hypothetical protein ACYSSI_10615, partial [Planctomycetota bacterium]
MNNNKIQKSFWKYRIIYLLLITVLLLFASHISCRVYRLLKGWPAGSGPAGPVVPAEPFESVWSDKEVLLIGLGDSITRGYGARPEHCYFSLLQNND